MKKKTVTILMAIALFSLGIAGAGKAYAYFTSYVEAAGSHEVVLGEETEINEEVVDGNKKIVIKNAEDSARAAYVRARAFAGSEIADSLEYSGDGWTAGNDGWYYYGDPIEPGESTSELLVQVKGRPADDDAIFSVTVVYESVDAIENGVDADGNVVYEPADWSANAGGGE